MSNFGSVIVFLYCRVHLVLVQICMCCQSQCEQYCSWKALICISVSSCMKCFFCLTIYFSSNLFSCVFRLILFQHLIDNYRAVYRKPLLLLSTDTRCEAWRNWLSFFIKFKGLLGQSRAGTCNTLSQDGYQPVVICRACLLDLDVVVTMVF